MLWVKFIAIFPTDNSLHAMLRWLPIYFLLLPRFLSEPSTLSSPWQTGSLVIPHSWMGIYKFHPHKRTWTLTYPKSGSGCSGRPRLDMHFGHRTGSWTVQRRSPCALKCLRNIFGGAAWWRMSLKIKQLFCHILTGKSSVSLKHALDVCLRALECVQVADKHSGINRLRILRVRLIWQFRHLHFAQDMRASFTCRERGETSNGG